MDWIDWMCISTIKFSCLSTNTPSGYFQSSRGLRQGDSLPYLFGFAMEVIRCLLEKARESGFLLGYSFRKGMEVSYLLFVNNNPVFYKASLSHMWYLSWWLMWFEVILGLKINLEKSDRILIGERVVANTETLALEWGCRIGYFPITYLGLSLGATFRVQLVWNSVEERFCKRLLLWKRQTFWKEGGWLKFKVLCPIYLFISRPYLAMPKKVKVRLFLWGGGVYRKRCI